ncbi:ABC-F family ATP-binding cassette domain-containing protein [Ureibacillus manganicus]|uniref:Multidrug ABC transporter ATP-binding protein n=1 Tax=Ureibacillus manganicus DSM 26584 TaxID=1384049 RepID=A0A0A3HWS9_9BACL|nr:ABC-F family ATP-binding cassette domain-containing protein [Ureibacillus manganicus]KGR76889.1 multidrug ABC transporter ATP-binding protein [Ureibacillus manganicus DSM 26584]
MIVLQVNQLNKSFGTDEILSGIKLEVQHRDRVALVGRNGAGKSTLLKIIAGQMSYDSGDIIIPKDVQLGYLEQHAGLNSTLSIWDEMMTIFSDLRSQEQNLRALEAKMADPSVYENNDTYQRIMSDYDQLQHGFKDAGGYQYEADTRSVLHGMQFYPEDYIKPISSLSGGQRTRLALAKLLLSKPDLLILDEPTNHLDIETLTWLENYLKSYEGAILIVSHDRYFLDQLVTIVYEVSRTHVTRFVGNYSAYLDEKAKNYERNLKTYEREQSEKAKLEAFIQKNIARASTTKMAQSRRKMLERTEWMNSPDGDERSANFGFTIEKQSGNDVLSIDHLAIGYDEQTIISKNISMRVYREDRIALVGPNGVGKSTLLKTIVKDLPIREGDIRYGTNVQISYYDQEQAKLTGNKPVLKELWDEWPLMNEKDIRTILGRFLFSGDDVAKPVHSLSGGEKARLALAKLMMQKGNLLVLDEPTNHLDLDSKEVLENALIDYPGTLLFVSHDRYFINRIATKVIELSSDGAFEYLGDYDYFLEKKQELEELAQMKAAANNSVEATSVKNITTQIDKEEKKRERQIRRLVEQIEKDMADLDKQIKQIEEDLCNPDIFQDHVMVMQLQSNLENLKSNYEHSELEWLELNEELEDIGS